MTLTSTVNKVNYSGDGATVLFSVPFVFWDSDDLQVVLTDSAGAETIWVRGTQYTVSGGSGADGSITVSTTPTDYTPATGTTLTILSNLTNTQDTSLPAGGSFPSASVEQEFDQTTRRIQQIAERAGRSLKVTFKDSSDGVSVDLPTISGEANNFLRVTSAETGLEWVAQTTTTASSSNSTPQVTSLPTGTPGTSGNFSRDDHVHQLHQGARTAERLAKFNHGGL